MVNAAGERVASGKPPTACDTPRGGARRQRRRGDRQRIVAPHVDLRLLGIGRDDPLMLGQHGVDPGRRGAAIGQFLDDPREQAEAPLPAAEAAGLQDAQDAASVIIGDGLVRHPACRSGFRGTLCECRDQPPRALQQGTLVVRQGAVVAGRRNCGTFRHAWPLLMAARRNGRRPSRRDCAGCTACRAMRFAARAAAILPAMRRHFCYEAGAARAECHP